MLSSTRDVSRIKGSSMSCSSEIASTSARGCPRGTTAGKGETSALDVQARPVLQQRR